MHVVKHIKFVVMIARARHWPYPTSESMSRSVYSPSVYVFVSQLVAFRHGLVTDVLYVYFIRPELLIFCAERKGFAVWRSHIVCRHDEFVDIFKRTCST